MKREGEKEKLLNVCACFCNVRITYHRHGTFVLGYN